MTEFAETKAVEREQPADRAPPLADADKQSLHFLFGTQQMMLEEMAFAADAMLDRVRTETHLWGEFAAKLAEAHSVRDWNAMARECGKHQLEFVRRDCDRLLMHGERVIAAATHGVLSGAAVDNLKNSRISEVVITNTLPVPQEKRFDKLKVLSIAPLIARAIHEVFNDGSVTSLFDGQS